MELERGRVILLKVGGHLAHVRVFSISNASVVHYELLSGVVVRRYKPESIAQLLER
jgi:hypothetical protein